MNVNIIFSQNKLKFKKKDGIYYKTVANIEITCIEKKRQKM